MAEKKSTFDAIHNAQMDQSRIKWAKMLALIEDVIDHTPEWSDEGSEEPLKFTELWLSRIHEMHNFNNLLNAMKKEAWEDFNQALDSTLVKLTVGAVNVPRVKDEVAAVAAVGDEVADVEEVEGNGRPLKRKKVYAADKNDLGKDGWFCV
ncbi:hypothetical protein CTI12_AA543960 [Artemisia annua]|uniref:Uncharacterized protein n=1 Tax=Artemisia annua TaxID=35608 RepID=A0A2U1KUR3_ARTAN|nr:hypothetical protein CTI12_AA543960 [Artemisia annua]